MRVRIFMLILFLAVTFTSCVKDSHPSWKTNIVAPLLYTRLDLKNLVSDTLINIDPDNFVSIIYENTLYELNVDSIVDFPDTITDILYQIPFSGIFNPGTQFVNTTEESIFNFGGAEISKIRIKSGKVHFKALNTIDEKVILNYRITSATKNGIAFGIVEKIPAGVSSPVTYEKDFDISGYEIDLTGISGGKINTLITVTQISTDPDGVAVYISQSDKVSISINFRELEIAYAKGYLGSDYFESGDQNSSFKIFEDIGEGTFDLEHVSLSLDIVNGFGIDLRMQINDLKSINTKTGLSIASNAFIINNPVNINRAIETFNPLYPVIPEMKHFDLGNSNVTDMIENMPDQISYSVDFVTNPLGNISSGNDFIYSGQHLKADLKLEIPLSIATNNLTIADTSDFAFNLGEDLSHVNSGIFTLIADNGFPFNAIIQVYLLKNNQMFDSLFISSTIIAAAPVDQNFKATGITRSIITTPVSYDKMHKLEEADKMAVKVSFTTLGNGQYIKLYYNYHLNIQLTGDFNLIVIQ